MLLHQEGDGARVDVADARAHHQALGGGEAHRRVDALAAVDGRNGAAVADVAGDDFPVADVDAEDFADALADVAVAGAVEAVAAHVVLGVILVGQGIEEAACGHGLVEGGVEDAHLGHAGEQGLHGVDAGDVGGVVEGSQVVALLDHLLDFGGDEDALAELLAAVDDAVAYGLDFGVGGDAAYLGVGEDVEDGLDGALVVGLAEFAHLLGAVFELELDEGAVDADFLDAALGEDNLAVGVDELVFYGAASAVENKNFHREGGYVLDVLDVGDVGTCLWHVGKGTCRPGVGPDIAKRCPYMGKPVFIWRRVLWRRWPGCRL